MVQPTKVISRNGDVIIDYHDRASGSDSPGTSHHWQVASEDLMLNSPYFRVLLDPNKFSEGRNLMEQKMSRLQVSAQETTFSSGEDIANMLPRVSLPADHLTRRLGVDALELFLRILSVNSLTDDERSGFESEIRSQPTSLIVRLVEISDIFNSPDIVRQMLKQSEYSFGKGRIVLSRFHPSLLRISEDRIRQIIFIADFLNEHSVFQVLTHTLIIVGSKFWVNGLEQPASDSLRWRYLPGLEGQ